MANLQTLSKPKKKDVCLEFQRSLGWEKAANSYWKVDWLAEEWKWIVHRLWTSKGADHMKVFV